VHDDVRSKVDGSTEVSSRTECVVNNHRNTSLVCDGNDLLEIWDVVLRVADTLELDSSQPLSPDILSRTHVNSLRLLVNRGLEVIGLVSIDELGLDAQTWEEDLQLVVCASVQVRRCDYVVPSMCESGNRNELCSLSRCCS
jgi:hypothetical protein